MEDIASVLAAQPFFEGIDARHLSVIAECATEARFGAGEQIFPAGAKADRFFLLREGKVVLSVAVPNGDPITIQRLTAGDVLGWSWLLPPYRWTFDARAQQPSRAVVLDGNRLRALIESDHELGCELLKRFVRVIAQRLQATRAELLEYHDAWAKLLDGRT
jgi:CRP/FNR family cyclic AMP-dependent transcriptional regulator